MAGKLALEARLHKADYHKIQKNCTFSTTRTLWKVKILNQLI
jgi:hypothetical protein